MKIVTTFFCLLAVTGALGQPVIVMDRFELQQTGDQLLLTDHAADTTLDLVNIDTWYTWVEYEIGVPNYLLNAPGTRWMPSVKSFQNGDKHILQLEEEGGNVYLFSYDGRQLDGWSYLYNMQRFHTHDDFPSAASIYYLISDVNQDGKFDLGVVEEEIYNKSGQPYYRTKPITWHLWTGEWWDIMPYLKASGYEDYQVFGPGHSKVDSVAMALWKTGNPLEWPVDGDKPIFISKDRMAKATQAAKKARDKKGLKALKNYENDWANLLYRPAKYKSFTYSAIVEASNRKLLERVGDTVATYFHLTSIDYLEVTYNWLQRYTEERSTVWCCGKRLEPGKATEGQFYLASLHYDFELPGAPWSKQRLMISLDSTLQLRGESGWGIVPPYLMDPDQQFLTQEEALKIARNTIYPLENEGEWMDGALEYDYSEDSYQWKVYSKRREGNCVFLRGYCELHAVTGKVVYYDVDKWKREDPDCK